MSIKYTQPNKVRTPARTCSSVEQAMRVAYRNQPVSDDDIKRAVEFLLQECQVHA